MPCRQGADDSDVTLADAPSRFGRELTACPGGLAGHGRFFAAGAPGSSAGAHGGITGTIAAG